MMTAYFYAIFASFFLVPVILGLVFAYAGVRLTTKLSFGVAIVLGLFLLETWLVSLPAIHIGLNIFPQDLVFVGLAAVGGVRMLAGTNPRPAAFAWFLFGVMLVVSFMLGVFKYRTEAGVDLRPTFYFWSTALYIGSFRIGIAEANRVMKFTLVAGIAVLLIVAYRWISDALHLGAVVFNQIGAGKPLRVVTAGQAYFLAAITIMLAWSAATGRVSKKASWLFIPFALAVLLLQHRSVWVATIVGLGVLYIGEPRLRGRFVRMSVLGSLVGAILLIPLTIFGVMDPIYTALDESVAETMLSHGSTLTWRMQSNQELFSQWLNGGLREYLIGKPFGSGYERFLSDLGHVTNYSPHNFYIQMLLRVGALGVTVVLVAYLYAARRLWVARVQDAASGFAGYLPLAAVLVSSLVFFYPYGAHFIQGMFLGLALAVLPETGLARQKSEPHSIASIPHAAK